MPSFYADQNFLNIVYACDIALENHFKSLLFLGESNRLVYSSNAYAMRKRSDGNNGELDLPFLNYRLNNYEPGIRTWWNLSSYTKGVYIPELEEKVKYAPITLTYEATFWAHRVDELIYAISTMNFDADNTTTLVPTVEIQSVDFPLSALLSYSGNQYEPTYNEQDWLERNNIHTITLPFTIDTMAIKTNSDITIPTEVILDLYAFYGNIDDIIT